MQLRTATRCRILGGGCNRLATNAQSIFNATARCFSIQNPNQNVSPNQRFSDYDDLIDAAGRQRDFAAVCQLLVKRMKHGRFNTSTLKVQYADVQVLPELLQNLANVDDWFTRKHAHDGVVAQLARLHRPGEALRVAETMANKNYGATSVTFHPILSVLTRRKEMEAAWRVVEVMRVLKVKRDVTALNYILTAYCCAGELAAAADVLVKLEEEGVNADARTYDALVLGACKARKLEVALRVIRRMAENGKAAMHSTHGHVVKEMVRCGYVAQAAEYVKIFAGRDRRLDAENFEFLASGLIKVKRIDEAESFVQEMKKRSLPISNGLKKILSASKS
ncbi:pentatricopeptide repeat-containing protein At2g40240, mitochondrial-like [Henckelia pumila]|uniref:pentatricopeptide repeat-containing protein At2g40240, mitochondrial-like n=1 Tax=Henckelia pumila TaxID=405737 RepID=UPI003C6E685C